MRPLRILIVMMDPPLPFGKAMGRWYYVLLRGLIERGHRVSAFATCATAEEVEKTRDLFAGTGTDLRCYQTPPPRHRLSSKWKTLRHPYSYVFSPALRRDLRAEMGRGFDVIHLEIQWSGWLALEHAQRAVLSIPYLFEIDLADQPVASLKEALLRRLTFRAERHLLRRYPSIIAVSPRLAERVRGIAPRADVYAIPFGLDLSLYPFADGLPADRPPTIGLIGSYNWTPGRTAGTRLLDRLWPELKRRVPEARLEIAGVGAREVFRGHLDRPDVTIRDFVADVPGFFRGIDLQLYAPNASSGMKFKVLESFAFGVPVVTTADGVEGIPARDGVHAGIATDDQGLVDRAVALLKYPERRHRQRLAARTLVESHCDPNAVLDQVEQVYARRLSLAPRPALSPL